MSKPNTPEQLSEEQKDAAVLRSVRPQRIILPLLIGIIYLGYTFWKKFDPNDFLNIKWTSNSFVWVGVAIVLLVIRHLAYAARIRSVSRKVFSFRKCIQFIFLWEFSSAVTPTALGGSAVALFFMSQDKFGLARASSIVLYTIVCDTLFFLLLLPLLALVFGASGIRPEVSSMLHLGNWSFLLYATYAFMLAYGSLFFYGLLINPDRTRSILLGLARLPLLSRFKEGAQKLGDDFVSASKELRNQDYGFHLRAIFFTTTAWSCKFLLMVCLCYAIAPGLELSPQPFFKMFSRMANMFVIVLISPTPGGSGFAEYAFTDFLKDFMNPGIGLVVAGLWRLLAYYSYLIAGAFIIPVWIQGLIARKRAFTTV